MRIVEFKDCAAIVLIHRSHPEWNVKGVFKPVFVCAEMFLDLKDVELRRWQIWRLRNELRTASLPVAMLAEFLLPEDIAWLEKTSMYIAHHWYLENERDWSEYRGVSLGRCCEYDIKAKSLRRLKFALTCKRLIERFPDRPVFSDYPPESNEWEILNMLGIAVRPFDVHSVTDAPPGRNFRHDLRVWLEKRVRLWGLDLLQMVSRLTTRRWSPDQPVAVVRLSLQNLKALEVWRREPIRRVQIAMWMDYLIRPKMVWNLLKSGAVIVDTPRNHAPLCLAELTEIGERWVGIRGSLRHIDSLTFWGVSLQPVFNRLFDSMVRTEFKSVCDLVDHAYRTLDNPRVTLLVLPNDCQLPLRTWTLVAKQLGKKTLVTQHGGPLDYKEDDNHLLGDYSAFWSEMEAREYIAAGLRPTQTLVTGSPNADIYYSGRAVSNSSARSGRIRILVITTGSPGVQAYLDEVWAPDYITDVLKNLCDGTGAFEVTVKLHPGESPALYREHMRPWLDQITSFKDIADLHALISHCDVVVSPLSTVVLEARAQGKPVILVPIKSVAGRMTNLERIQGVVTVRDGDSISAIARRIVQEGVGSSADEVDVTQYIGPLDGQSSQRLFEAIQRISLMD